MTADQQGRKTELAFWDGLYTRRIRMSLPSGLVISTRNLLTLLRSRIQPGQRVLEIGFAPGKLLVFAGKVLGADVAGIDYSPNGVAASRELFRALGIDGDLRCEDVFQTSFSPGSFDLVYSNGLIEHFEDPCPIVRKHVELAKPGGRILVLVPNYGGVYGRIQRRLDPENLAIHNLDIMSESGMRRLVPEDLVRNVRVFYTGKLNLWLISLHRSLPGPLAQAVYLAGNAAGLLQPIVIKKIAPLIGLEMIRSH
jgi:2-polyprenyl-3-methyl-5-hydroxy-6-metoxy-1,4-benzoquinol methylase